MTTYENKLRREELYKNKTLLEEIEQLSEVGGWEYDVVTKLFTWTYGVYRIHGVTPDTYDPNQVDQSIEFYPPHTRVIITEAFDKAVNLGTPYDLELNFIKATGEHIWVRTRGSPEIKDGKVVRVIGYLMDITERKRSEEALHRTRDLQLAILNNTHVMMACLDREFNFIIVNEIYALADGQEPDFFIGKNHFSLFPSAENEAIFRRVVNIGEPYYSFAKPFENVMHPERGIGQWDWSLKPVRDTGGQVSMLVLTLLDVTSRVQAEEALRDEMQEKALILDNVNTAIAFHDVENNFLWANKTYMDICGVSRSELHGRKCYVCWGLDRLCVNCPVTLSIQAGQPQFGEMTPENQPHWPANQGSWLVRSAPVRDNTGKIIGAIEVANDITERKRLEDELKKYNETLEDNVRKRTEDLQQLNEVLLKSNKELESFAYITSHDLQEPLRMVSSYTQLLAQKYKDQLDENANDYINFAVDGAKRMYDLINGLLRYSRISRKGTAITDVDINKVIDTVKANVAQIIKERNVLIETVNLPVVFADFSQMVQLFQNLIANGIKFSKDEPRISISSKTEESQCVFSVKDNGIGIESQYFDHIFEIFKRLNPRDQFEGTGIGLAICKRIVENHNGRIWLESEPGAGSLFYFTIPSKKIKVL